jgi:hypothetical protein
VAAKWYLLARIYRKTSLLADWNNVWYKLTGFCGVPVGGLATRNTPVRLPAIAQLKI